MFKLFFYYSFKVFGHCDATRRFLPAEYAICNTENSWAYKILFARLGFSPNYVMADGVVGLQTAINKTFEAHVSRLMCFYHAKASMERKALPLQLLKAH